MAGDLVRNPNLEPSSGVRRRDSSLRSARRRTVMRAITFIGSMLGLAWLMCVALIEVTGRRDEARAGDRRRSDAIVVLGAAQYEGRPSPVLRARLDHAVSLWRRGLAPRLILTGGTGVGDTTSEAAVGRKYAIRQGVPDSAIVTERHGRTTSESLRAVAQIMEHRGEHSIILVSDPFHMLRLSILSRRFGLEPRVSPTRTSPISSNRQERWKYVVSESFKVPLAFILEWRSK